MKLLSLEMDVSSDDEHHFLHSFTVLPDFDSNSFEEWRLLDSRVAVVSTPRNIAQKDTSRRHGKKGKKGFEIHNRPQGLSFSDSVPISKTCSSTENVDELGSSEKIETLFGGKWRSENPNHGKFNFKLHNNPVTEVSCVSASSSSSLLKLFMTPPSAHGTRGFIFHPRKIGSVRKIGTQNTCALSMGGLLCSSVVGTTIKFNPPAGTDSMMKNGISTNVSTKHHCLTAMKEYEAKSLEELRLEDYAANRKVGTMTTGGSLFGAAPTQNTGSLFGATSTSQATTGFGIFGGTQPAASGGLFGQTSTASTGGLFGGATQTSGSSLFGGQAKPATGGLFGTQPQTSQTGGIFGSNTGAFGTTGQTNSGSIFGGSALGAQNTKTGFGFGLTNTTTTQSSIFNFGTTTTQAGGLFGANNQSKSIFGAPTSGFGSTVTTGSVFNNPQTSSGGLFGAKPTGFGAPNSTSGGLFGAPATQSAFGPTGSLFGGIGGTTQQTAGLSGGLLGNTGSTLNLGATVPPTQLTTDPNTANAQHQMLQQQILALATSPYGDSPLFRNSLDSSKNDQRLQPVSSAAQKQHLSPSQHKVETKPRLSVKPKLHKNSRLFDGLDEEDDSLIIRQSFVPRNNPKTLTIKPPTHTSSTALPLSVSMSLSNGDFGKSDFSHLNPQDLAASFLLASQSENQSLSTSGRSEPKRSSKAPDSGTQTDSVAPVESSSLTLSESLADIPSETPKSQKWQTKKSDDISGNRLPRDSNNGTTGRSSLNATDDNELDGLSAPNYVMSPLSPDSSKKPESDSFSKLHQRASVTSPIQGKENSMSNLDYARTSQEGKGGIKLYRPEYFTIPSKDQLDKELADIGKCVVQDFTIGRDGYGSVHFPGTTDITDIDLDDIVHIRRKEVTLYPDDETKPELGYGLNKRAVITLDKVWPIDKSNHLPITSPQKLLTMGYKDKIERSTAKLQAKFIEYRPETGSWVFEVKHFSKYKLFDDSDDEEETDSKQNGVAESAKVVCQTPVEQNTFIVQSTKNKETSNYGMMPGSQVLKSRGLGGYDSVALENETSQQFLSNETWNAANKGKVLEVIDDSELVLQEEMKTNFFQPCWKPSVVTKVDQMRATLFADEKELHDQNGLSGDSWDLEKQFEIEATTRSRHSQLPRCLRVDTIVKDFKKEGLTKFVEKQQVFQPEFEGIDLNQEVFDVTDISLLRKYKDHGLRNGSRSYRVSWKRNETAISCPIPQKSLKSLPISLFKKPSEPFKVIVSDVFETKFSHPPETVSKILRLFSEFASNDMHSDFPKYAMVESQELVRSLIDTDISLPVLQNAISLCYSLFGTVDEDELLSPASFGHSYEIYQRRREYFGKWLTESCKQEMSAEETPIKSGNIIQRLMLLLTSNQREEAVHLALSSNLPRLALLISQESSGDLQRILTHVIQEWDSLGISDCIDVETLKLYKLLAGDFNIINHGAVEHVVCGGLGWKRCLGASLWFGTHQNSSIKSSIVNYTNLFEEGLCSAPTAVSSISDETEMGDNPNFSYYDCCYHLMNLVTDETYKPELALNPLTITHDVADYYPSWVLMNVLVTLGFCHLEESVKLNITTNFAWQLERAGLWPWSVFVLSFVSSDLGRQSVIQDLMDRNCTSSNDFSSDELFLINDLRISPKAVRRSKALKAKMEKKPSTQLYQLLEAEEFSMAHDLLIDEELSAHLYFNNKKDFLYEALETLGIHKHCLPYWDSKGGVVFEFLGLQRSAVDLSSQPITQNDLSESLFGIYTSFVLLLSKLVEFPVQTGVMKSLLEEIAESVVVNIRMLNKNESGDLLAPFMKRLPLLRDQSLAQMRKLTTDVVSTLSETNIDEATLNNELEPFSER